MQGWALTCQQLRAVLLKRLLLAHRSRRGLFAQVWGLATGEGAREPLGICPALCSLIQLPEPGYTPHPAHLPETACIGSQGWCRAGGREGPVSLAHGRGGQLTAGPADCAARPLRGPGAGLQPHRASIRVLPVSAAQPQPVRRPGVLLQVGAEDRVLVVRGPGGHRHSPDRVPPQRGCPQGPRACPPAGGAAGGRWIGRRLSAEQLPQVRPPPGPCPSLALVSLPGLWPAERPCACSGPRRRAPTALPRPLRTPSVCWFSVPEVPADVAEVLASGNWTPASPSPACQCSQPGARRLLPDCPPAAGGPPPPQVQTASGETVQNLTGRNLSDFLVKTYPRLVHQG